MVSRQENTHLFNGHSGQTTWGMVSPRRCPLRLRLRMEATSRNLQEQPRDAISRAQHTTRKETIELSPGTWVMHFCCGKSDSWSDRGSIQIRSLVGTCACHDSVSQQWSGPVHSTTEQNGVVWIFHGNKLIRCHATQLRRCSEREASIVL